MSSLISMFAVACVLLPSGWLSQSQHWLLGHMVERRPVQQTSRSRRTQDPLLRSRSQAHCAPVVGEPWQLHTTSTSADETKELRPQTLGSVQASYCCCHNARTTSPQSSNVAFTGLPGGPALSPEYIDIKQHNMARTTKTIATEATISISIACHSA